MQELTQRDYEFLLKGIGLTRLNKAMIHRLVILGWPERLVLAIVHASEGAARYYRRRGSIVVELSSCVHGATFAEHFKTGAFQIFMITVIPGLASECEECSTFWKGMKHA